MQLVYFLLGLTILLLSGTGLFMAIYVAVEWRRGSLLRKEGKITQGVITGTRIETHRVHTSRTSYDQTTYHVAFSYTVEGKTYSQEVLVNKKDYETLWKGAPVSVRYVPTRPEMVRLVDETTHKLAIPILICCSSLCFLGTAGLVIGLITHPV